MYASQTESLKADNNPNTSGMIWEKLHKDITALNWKDGYIYRGITCMIPPVCPSKVLISDHIFFFTFY